ARAHDLDPAGRGGDRPPGAHWGHRSAPLRRRHGRLPGPQRGREPDPHPAFRRPRSGVGERHLADLPRGRVLLGAVAQDRRAQGEPQRMKPQLSVVATSRNDEHGGHLLARMQLFVEGLEEQAVRFRLPVELVLVEWNPPADRPPLVDALRWSPNDYFQPRVITVPADVHQAFAHADGLPLPAECRALPVIREHRIDGLRYPNGRPPVMRGQNSGPRFGINTAVIELTRVAAAARDRMVLPKLHTSGCGDFTLTSREVWFGIHGYPEWPA